MLIAGPPVAEWIAGVHTADWRLFQTRLRVRAAAVAAVLLLLQAGLRVRAAAVGDWRLLQARLRVRAEGADVRDEEGPEGLAGLVPATGGAVRRDRRLTARTEVTAQSTAHRTTGHSD